jgi:hypothetical protein
MVWPSNAWRSGAGVPWSNNILMQARWLECSCHQALLGVAEHELNLFARHARKPFQEIIDPRTVLEILEQGSHRDTRRFEQPLTAAFAGRAFDRGTLAPIEHVANPKWSDALLQARLIGSFIRHIPG